MNAPPAGTTEEREAAEAQQEARLIARIADGDARSYAILVERYQRRLYWACLRLVGDPDDADDAVQEAFVRAYEHLGEYDPAYRFYAWIYRIARNRCLNVVRRRRLWGLVSFSDPERSPVVAGADAADQPVADGELGRALADCRQRLSADQRECFDLRHAEGLRYAEIAAALEIAEGTVMSRLARGRDRMRQCLKEKGFVG